MALEKCDKCGHEWLPIKCPECGGVEEGICKACGNELMWIECEECDGNGYMYIKGEEWKCNHIPNYYGNNGSHGFWACPNPNCAQEEAMSLYREKKIKEKEIKDEKEKNRVLDDFDLMEIEEEKERDFTRLVFPGEISEEIIILEEIEKQRQSHQESLENAIEDYFEKVRQGANLTEEQARAITYLYWVDILPVSKLTEFTGLKGFDFKNAISPCPMSFPCLNCGPKTEITINATTKLQRKKTQKIFDDIIEKDSYSLPISKELGQFFCKDCLPIIVQKGEEVRKRYLSDWEMKRQNALAEIVRLRELPYDEYLQSDHWQNTRRKALKYYGYRCRSCNTNSQELHVHHKTYERRGCEMMSDLIVLCKDHHSEIHGFLKE